jgi:hypothetical protein
MHGLKAPFPKVAPAAPPHDSVEMQQFDNGHLIYIVYQGIIHNTRVALSPVGTVRVVRQKFTLEDAFGSHACSLEVDMRVINSIHLGCSLLLPVDTVNCVQTRKAFKQMCPWQRNGMQRSGGSRCWLIGTSRPSGNGHFTLITTRLLHGALDCARC